MEGALSHQEATSKRHTASGQRLTANSFNHMACEQVVCEHMTCDQVASIKQHAPSGWLPDASGTWQAASIKSHQPSGKKQ
eukprot:15474983-Alexandrium_andersonii.AAC.1